jgi:hypothetical protein
VGFKVEGNPTRRLVLQRRQNAFPVSYRLCCSKHCRAAFEESSAPRLVADTVDLAVGIFELQATNDAGGALQVPPRGIVGTGYDQPLAQLVLLLAG